MKIQKYAKEFGMAMIAYIIIVVISLRILGAGIESQTLRALISISPIIPLIAVCWTILRNIRRSDELQRAIQVEALAIALAGTAILTMGYGFLENVGYPRLTMFVVWPVIAVLWTISLFISTQRYK